MSSAKIQNQKVITREIANQYMSRKNKNKKNNKKNTPRTTSFTCQKH